MPKVNKILAAVNGSETCLNVLRVAAAFARRTKSSLTALAVAPPYEGDLGLVGVKGIESVVWEPCGKVFAQTQKVAAEEGIYIRPAFATGKVHECIIEHAEARKIDLVIMGAGKLGSMSRFFLGSVAAKVLRCIPTDVLVVPDVLKENTGGILAVLNPSEQGTPAVGWALDLAWLYECDLTVASLPVPTLTRIESGDGAVGNSESKRNLGELQHLAGLLNVRFQHVPLQNGTCTEICELAEDHRTDLIILSSHFSAKKKGLLSGSPTERLIRNSACAVLVTKAVPLATAEPPSIAREQAFAHSS